jgi:hypothetical protein
MKFEVDKKHIESGLIEEKKHQHSPLVMYCYTKRCEELAEWDEQTLMCNGIIVHNETKEIVARPFKKFFSTEELTLHSMEVPEVYKKMDGTLGILYWVKDRPNIATKDGFHSEEAKWANAYILYNEINLEHLDRGLTYLFEIISPDSKKVVDYGDREALVFLAAIEIETGKTADVKQCSPFKSAPTVPYKPFAELEAIDVPNEEGYVVHYPNQDFRIKIQFPWYIKTKNNG